MTTDKRNTSKSTESRGPKTGAQPGKVKGAGEVTPKASPEAEGIYENVAAEINKPAPEERKGVIHDDNEREVDLAYQAGRQASETGTPGKPPLGYEPEEVKAWYEGYKSHANPNSQSQVEGIESGYRKDY